MERREQTSTSDESQQAPAGFEDQVTYPDMSSVETTKIPPWTADSATSPVHEPQLPPPSEDTLTSSAASLSESPASEPASLTRRQAILSEDQDKSSLLHFSPQTDTTYMVSHSRTPNQRRSRQIGRLLMLMFAANLLMLAAGGLWLYNRISEDFEERLFRGNSKTPETTVAPPPSPVSEQVPKTDPQYQARLEKLESELKESQARLLNAEEQTRRQAASLEAIAANSSKPPVAAPEVAPRATEQPPGIPETSLPLQQSELVLLKERNRLTSYADEAIATASRASYEKLWAALDDPRLANLVHASRSEILRVQNYYLSGSRLEQYQISVADYYPDQANLRDAQLKDDQLITLLSNGKNPWQVRMKSANLLGQRRSTAVGDALVKAIKNDNNLDVVKEATFSFEQMTGYRARIFETASLDAWWKQYNTPPPASPPGKKETGNAPAPAKP